MTRSQPAHTAPQSLAGQVAAAAALLLAGLASAATAADPAPPDFNRDIRPILSGRCFACHGPDAEDRHAGLRLDLRDAAIAPLADGGTAIVPGKPAASGLIARVTSGDPDMVMPPPRVGKPVTPAEADLLRRWIAAGAEYRGHFAFERIERPAAPEVRRRDWPRTPIDRFILARLEAERLAPAGEADRATLIRRLTLDLLGLPPTPEEVDAFVADTAADAYDRVVDRLLADRRFGERMALEWLDAARYADSHGYQVDASRANWPWRDWVIDAFNRNMPFDQFTIEQLAGDMLPNATTEQIVATGFNRNHRLNNEGGIIPEEWRVETVIDRVETTGQTWLGLSVGCARCHDHKYDPLSQREFYGLFAIFNNVPESGMGNDSGGNVAPVKRVPTSEQAAEIVRLEAALAAAERSLNGERDAIDDHIATWEKELPAVRARPADAWQHLEPATTASTGKATFRRSEDGSWIVEGPQPPTDVYEIRAPLAPGHLGGLRLEVLPGAQGLARGAGDRVVVTKIEAEIERTGSPALPVKLERAAADAEPPGWGAENVLKGDRAKGWAVEGAPEQAGPRRVAVFPTRPVAVPADARIVIRIRQESATPGLTIAAFRLAISSTPPGLLDAAGFALPDAVAAVLGIEPDKRTPEQAEQLRTFYADRVGGPIWRAEVARDEAKRRLESFTGPLPTAMVMQEGPRRDTFLLVRGEYDKRGDKVEAALPAFLPAPPAGAPINRLSFARWLVSREHPLTARVWVNRQWERFFGVGLVKSSENLGSQADYPSHPQLLDWMAADFLESGWDMKRFIRQLVTSAVYRQSSRLAPGMQDRDPENRLLARAPRIRLPGEIIRDAALAAGGLLVPTIGGPSVRPWMPEGVWDETTKYGDLRNYKPDTGEGRYRRTMYTVWKRTAGPPTMLLFDAPGREICTVRRSRTNTPLQALALLNETTFVEAANGLARRMVAAGKADPAARIERGFRLAVGRPPSAAELRILVAGFEADRGRFAADPEATKKYLAVGLVRKPDGVAADEFAAYALTANVLLNLDEFVMRD